MIKMLRFKPPCSWKCECGREHKISIKKITVENDVIEKVGKIIDELNIGKKCLIVEDEITKKIAGDGIKESLKDFDVFETVITAVNEKNINKVSNLIKNFNFAIAVGGGSIIDVTKYTTFQHNKPFISFPTTPSHDGIASARASLVERGVSKPAHPPIAVIADLKIIRQSPPRMISAGYGDLIAKITALKDWQLGRDEKNEDYCNYIEKFILSAVNNAIKNSDGIKKRSTLSIKSLVNDLIACSIAMLCWNSSRPCSGSEHLFSHYLDLHAKKPMMHGEQCGMGTLLMATWHKKYNENWWSQPKYQPQNIRKMLENLNVPITPNPIGISHEEVIKALTHAHKLRPERYTILHKQPLKTCDAKKLLEESGVDK